MSKHYLVVGGTRGIGRALIASLCKRGKRVSILARTKPTVPIPDALYCSTDILDPTRTAEKLKYAVDINGPLSYVIFCQRYRGSLDSWSGQLDTVLTAAKNIITNLRDSFLSKGDRAILFVGSVASNFVLPEQDVGYHVAKAGEIQMMRYYAMTLGRLGVRVNCVTLATMLKPEAEAFYKEHAALEQSKANLSPLGRMGRPADFVNAVEFLCSARANFITGQNLVVDGGVTMMGHEALAGALIGRDVLRSKKDRL